jgi:hypothetical protein
LALVPLRLLHARLVLQGMGYKKRCVLGEDRVLEVQGGPAGHGCGHSFGIALKKSYCIVSCTLRTPNNGKKNALSCLPFQKHIHTEKKRNP